MYVFIFYFIGKYKKKKINKWKTHYLFFLLLTSLMLKHILLFPYRYINVIINGLMEYIMILSLILKPIRLDLFNSFQLKQFKKPEDLYFNWLFVIQVSNNKLIIVPSRGKKD